ncbi:DUF5684 domain-containing protein [Microbacterium sp. C7(2022)]|uniref:DUF5684 domain-containing protein n=1 Tax=Microbacterium sp. C7(2022) TaxID=2992759 RepID=UPI00237A1261|nr:DUF5684 domain-containing protein [Microbacterium sp. C7(2022)]MDE0545309.1 DUF5684 domain-containing protein [Microbacterium sp. C7(2022)]
MQDSSAVLGLVTFLLIVGVYVWTSLALGAVFRKSGDEAWKAWVPIYNQVILLRLGGFSPLLLLLYLVPFFGATAVWILQIVSCHTINRAFGLGGGMTVLAALLFPVWATVLGFGSARWVGDTPPGAWPQKESDAAPDPLPTSLSTAAPEAYHPSSDIPAPTAWAPTPPPAASTPPAPPAAPPLPPPPTMSAAAAAAAGPRRGSADDTPVDQSEGLISSVPYSRPGAPEAPEVPERPAVFPPMTLDTDDDWEDTSAPASSHTPVSAVRGGEDDPDAPPPGVLRRSAFDSMADEVTLPPVTRVPADPPSAPDRDPWAPNESEPFPETSGPVSAVVGAPEAGMPRSARTSVSAHHTRPEIPDEDDSLDETVIARRRRTNWALVLPSGDPVALIADVVLVGRRPSPRADHPGAQLVAVDDGTVSKTHALLQLRDDRWYITDLDSTNGVIFATLVGTEVEATPGVETEAGDRFLLGDAEVRLVRSDG